MASTIIMLMAITVAGLLFGIVLVARRKAAPASRGHGDGGDISWMTGVTSFGDSGSSDCSSADSGTGCDGGGGSDGGGGGGGD